MGIDHDLKKRSIIVVLTLLIVGCRGIVTPVVPTIMATEVVIAVVTNVATILPTATALPTLTPTTVPTATPEPTATIPTGSIELIGAQLPPGFSMIKYADFYRPTSMVFDSKRNLYVTSFDGTVHVLQDLDLDHRAETDHLFFKGMNTPLGITVHQPTGDIYVSSNGKISILRDPDGDFVAEGVNFVSDLPIGLHQNNNLKWGMDGWLYMGVGSTCNVCYEEDERSATILRFNIESKVWEIVATGLRNPYDLAFHPQTGDLFATDNGRDDLGDDAPSEELNHIVMGGNYGFPDCWDQLVGPDCTDTTAAVAFFDPHSSANSLDFYTADRFPEAYRNDLFVTIFGSWLISGVSTGIKRIDLQLVDGQYVASASWFAKWDGMPLGLTLGPDGAIYVGDYINDAIYRISYGE